MKARSLYQSPVKPLRQPSVPLSSPSCLEVNVYDAIGAVIATVFAFAFSLVVEKYVRIPFLSAAFAAAFVFGFLAHIWTRYSGFSLPIRISLSQAVSCPSFLELL